MTNTLRNRLCILCLATWTPGLFWTSHAAGDEPGDQRPSRGVVVAADERVPPRVGDAEDAVATSEPDSQTSIDRTGSGSRQLTDPLLCQPDGLYFSDSFSPGHVSPRWFFRKYWSVEDGVLLRNDLPQTNDRIFIKKPVYKDVLIRFDFQFRGATEIRLVTGTPGHYNAVIHIQRDQFYLQTAGDDSGPYFPFRHGECAYDFRPRQWYTMLIEIVGDQAVAYLDREHLAYGRHPILDKRRSYFAIQVDRASAAFDNLRIFQATAHPRQLEHLAHIRSVSGRHPVRKSLRQQWDIQRRNAHEHLYQTDRAYRALVRRVASQHDKEKHLYPDVFRSHKEFQHEIAEYRKQLLANDAEYKRTLFATHRAARALDAFLLAQDSQVDALPPSRRERELERLRVRFREQPEYVELVAARDAAQRVLENQYPKLFTTNADITAFRREARKPVQAKPAFQVLVKETAVAYRAQQAYLLSHDSKLATLRDQLDALKR